MSDGNLRELAPQVLTALVRRFGHFDLAEDAVQEALLAAARQWPADGVPDDPRAWLIAVGARRLTDQLRSDDARRRREEADARLAGPEPHTDPDATDDTLVLLFTCCHPDLSPASQIALMLRAVGGLTTAEIARAFLVPEATMTRRITRAKATITGSGVRFAMPEGSDHTDRLSAVLHALYLLFNEGYASTSGPDLQRVEPADEAVRLARLVYRLVPDDGEVAGLLALMLLTDARRQARTDARGDLVPMAEQDRTLWDRAAIAEGTALIDSVLGRGPIGSYQVQAAIAALHDAAVDATATDWPQIVALYGVLRRIADSPVIALNQAVATAMAEGPQAGLALLDALDGDRVLARDHRLPAARAHLLELAGDPAGARQQYAAAAARTTNPTQRRYLDARRARLGCPDQG